jgi:hypothetical protein
MALDREKLGNFVGMLIATLRGEIGETSQRAERLGGALKELRAVREDAEARLRASRAQRAKREERLNRANEARAREAG